MPMTPEEKEAFLKEKGLTHEQVLQMAKQRGLAPESESSEPGFVERNINRFAGAGDTAAQNLLTAAHHIIPGMPQTHIIPNASGEAYEGGKWLGDVVPYLMASAAAPEAIPAMTGRAGLAGIASRALGNAAYSGATSEDNSGQNALFGGGLSASLDVLPKALGVVGKGINKLVPTQVVNEMMQKLSGAKAWNAATSIADNAKKVTGDILDKFEEVKNSGVDKFKSVLAPHKETLLYDVKGLGGMLAKGGGSSSSEIESSLKELLQDDALSVPKELKQRINKFLSKPTIDEGHWLQSDLQTFASKSSKFPGSVADTALISKIKTPANLISEGIDNKLKEVSPKDAESYRSAKDYWKNRVRPYQDAKGIKDIVNPGNEKVTVQKDVHNYFKRPDVEGISEEFGRSKNTDVAQIFKDLDASSQKKIMFSRLAQAAKGSPEKLLEELGKLDQEGLSHYLPGEMSDLSKTLSRALTAKSVAQPVLGASAGALLGGGMGAGLGSAIGVGLKDVLSKIPGLAYGNSVSAVGRAIDNPLVKKLILGNYLTGRQK